MKTILFISLFIFYTCFGFIPNNNIQIERDSNMITRVSGDKIYMDGKKYFKKRKIFHIKFTNQQRVSKYLHKSKIIHPPV